MLRKAFFAFNLFRKKKVMNIAFWFIDKKHSMP